MNSPDATRSNPHAQEAIQYRIANFLRTGKGTQKQASGIFQVSLSVVEKIWKQYREGGLKALQAKKRGPVQSTALLSKAQVKQVSHLIKKGTPDRHGLPGFLWTADAVSLLIKKKVK